MFMLSGKGWCWRLPTDDDGQVRLQGGLDAGVPDRVARRLQPPSGDDAA
jgi:hypothetical protein